MWVRGSALRRGEPGFIESPYCNDYSGPTLNMKIIVLIKYITTSMICSQGGTVLITVMAHIGSISLTKILHSVGVMGVYSLHKNTAV